MNTTRLFPLTALAMGAMIYACTAEMPGAPDANTPIFGKKAQPQKINMCHVEGNGSWHPIWIAAKAMPAHQAHGDWEVGPEVCDGIDNNCGGWVDEGGVCPISGWECSYVFGPCSDFVGLEAEADRLDAAIRAFEAVLDRTTDLIEVEAASDELTAALAAFNTGLEAAWPQMVPDQRAALQAHYRTLRDVVEGLEQECNLRLAPQFRCQIGERPIRPMDGPALVWAGSRGLL